MKQESAGCGEEDSPPFRRVSPGSRTLLSGLVLCPPSPRPCLEGALGTGQHHVRSDLGQHCFKSFVNRWDQISCMSLNRVSIFNFCQPQFPHLHNEAVGIFLTRLP